MKNKQTSNDQQSYNGYTVYESNQTYTSDDFVKSKAKKIGWFARQSVVRRIRFSFICLSIILFLVVGTLNLFMYLDLSLTQEDDFAFILPPFFFVVIALLISLALSLLFSFMLIKWLVKPVERMVVGAKELGKGNFSHRVHMTGNDEFALMGKTFDDMASSIEKIQRTERSLTNDIAHELKTPLASMQATVEAMIDGVYEPSKERLNVVELEIKRLSRLVEAILNLARIENRKISLHKEKFDFSEVAKKIARFHQALFVDAGIEYEYDINGTAYVYADKDLILQAMTNLISNAFRYTKKGGHVKIYTNVHDNYVRFYVRDTGIGISEEDKEKLFMRFFRAKEAAEIEGCGSGVGLSIVKEIIDIHNGWIAVKSELGKGSCFIIGIPIVENK